MKTTSGNFHAIIENSINAFFLGIPDGTILDASNAAIEMFGYTLQEFKEYGRTVLFGDTAEHLNALLSIREKNSKVKGELIGIRKNGERFPCEFSSVIFKNENGETRTSTTIIDITERKKVEAENSLLIDNTEECFILLDRNLRIMSFNKQFEACYDDFLGRKVKKGDFVLEYAKENRLNALRRIYDKVLNGDVIDNTITVLTKDKKPVVFANRYKPAFDGNKSIIGVFVTSKDVTKQKQEEQRLKLLESVITHATDSVLITEPHAETGDQITVFVNDAFIKMTGYLKEEIIGKSPRMFQGPKTDRKELDKLKHCISKNIECQTEIINYKKNGEEFWVKMSISPVYNATEKLTHFIAIESDITERKLREIERDQIISELSQNNKDLREFSYVTSHNLRAPIANLLGLTNLINNYEVADTSLKQILDGVRKSALMFDDTVKDLTKVLIIKDQTNISKEDIFVLSAMNKTLALLNIDESSSEVSITHDFSKAPIISFINAYLESVFVNLFTNALKYKSPNRSLKIHIKTEDNKGFYVLRFSDNGIGLDTEKHQEKLFKLYQRFHDHSEGKGLGLYLIKSQLEALGGTIEVESRVNVGTTFILKFKK